ncbi:MAG: hypothetical protein QXF78_05425 [Pyrobaculum sp.]
MRQISTLGFDWRHVLAVAKDHNVKELYLVTANTPHEKTEEAKRQILKIAPHIGVETIEEVVATTHDVWQCVSEIAELFHTDKPIVVDIGGGVRSLNLCLTLAAILAQEILDTEIHAIYTQAEDQGKIIQVDPAPLQFAKTLKGKKPKTRIKTLQTLTFEGKYGKRLHQQFKQYGLIKDNKPTTAAQAILKYIQLRQT